MLRLWIASLRLQGRHRGKRSQWTVRRRRAADALAEGTWAVDAPFHHHSPSSGVFSPQGLILHVSKGQTMLAWQTFLEAVDQQAKLQAKLAELAMENCLASSQAFIRPPTGQEQDLPSNEPIGFREAPAALDVPFGSITIEYEGGIAVAAVHVDVVVSDEAFEPAADTRLMMDFKHQVDVGTVNRSAIAARSCAMMIRRLRSAADLLEAMPAVSLLEPGAILPGG